MHMTVALTGHGLSLVSVDVLCRLSSGPVLDVCIPASFDRFSFWLKYA